MGKKERLWLGAVWWQEVLRDQIKGRDDLFAETPPLEAQRMLFSRAVTLREDGAVRKLPFGDVKKVHLYPVCEGDIYIGLPRRQGLKKGSVANSNIGCTGSGRQPRNGRNITSKS